MTESSADARGPVARSTQGATEETGVVLSLPNRINAPADPPIMALGLALPSRRPAARAAFGRP